MEISLRKVFLIGATFEVLAVKLHIVLIKERYLSDIERVSTAYTQALAKKFTSNNACLRKKWEPSYYQAQGSRMRQQSRALHDPVLPKIS